MAKLHKTEVVEVGCSEILSALRESGLNLGKPAHVKFVSGADQKIFEDDDKLQFTFISKAVEMERVKADPHE